LPFKIQNLINFTYKGLERANSPINGEITVYSLFGSARITIGGLLQAGGIVGNIWQKSIKQITNYKLPITKILILGLGCGTAARLFSKQWPEAKIIGVEIDPEVIRLGKKYFDLDKIPHLKIICRDAINYIKNTSEVVRSGSSKEKNSFELIIVDLYVGEKIPSQSESLSFLRELRNLIAKNGLVIFNRIFWDKHKKEAERFAKKAEKIFPKVELARTVANLLVICQN